MSEPQGTAYNHLIATISTTFSNGQAQTISSINSGLTITYWKIGQYIVEFEQQGKENAEYGKKLLKNISYDLQIQHGKGFSLSNVKRFRQFYLANRISATVSLQLSWSHHVELLKISNEIERTFYANQTLNAKWSVRELKRQKSSALFLRLAASKDKQSVLQLAQQNTLVAKPEDI